MPQLDQIIIFSQIFWLFIIFTIFYIILTHFFLPLFIKSIKSRKRILESNFLESSQIIQQSNRKQIYLKKVLLKNLNLIKKVVTNDFIFSEVIIDNAFFQLIDTKISFMLFDSILYCDNQILESIVFNFKSLNLSYKLN